MPFSFPRNLHTWGEPPSTREYGSNTQISVLLTLLPLLPRHPQPPPAPPIPLHRWSLLPSPATPPETKLQKLLLPAPAQSPRGSHQQESRHPQHRGLAPHSHTNTPPLNSHHHHCPPLPNTSQLRKEELANLSTKLQLGTHLSQKQQKTQSTKDQLICKLNAHLYGRQVPHNQIRR